MWKLFIAPFTVSFIGFFIVYWFGGFAALSLVFFLTLLEVSLSFDNAVVNAKVLERMDEKWRKRFLTWGMLVAVFGTRLVLPVLIVAAAAWVSPITITHLLFANPQEYSHMIERVAPIIHAFGGAFLLMVALRYFFDQAKSIHWIHPVEKHLTVWGRVQAMEVLITMVVILLTAWTVPEHAAMILAAGCIGIMLFILMEGLVHALDDGAKHVAKAGLSLFLYLNLLDAAFSLDGVIGAFALTTDIIIIITGLGIGAYFVRTLTLYFVRRRTLATLLYLEHGAYWAIAALGLCMFINIGTHLSEALVGTISILFIAAAYFSSLKVRGVSRADDL